MMPMSWKLPALLLVLAPLWAQEKAKPRDITVEKEETTEKAPEAPAAVIIPHSYAIVAGIATYANLPPEAQLHFSERDAEAIYSVLISPEGGNFHAENVHRLIGPKATLANLRHELEDWLPSVSKDGDRVLIYFAGHGFVYPQNGGRAYLAPYDIDPRNIENTGYPMDRLATIIGSKVQAKSKILITDSCHSGAIRPEDTQNFNHAVVDVSKSLFSLTASRDRERSFESASWGGGHGIFTYYVVKGLEGQADENGDGIVTADELQEYVHRNVREASKGQQNPTADAGSFDPHMLLAYVPSHARPNAPEKPKFGTFIVQTQTDGVEFFLDGKSMGVVNKDTPLKLQGLQPGPHTIQGVKMGYEPDGPREETVYPGQDSTILIRTLIARRRNRAAAEDLERGLADYNKGYADNYKKALVEFQKAFDADPAYSQAALYLGRTYNALFDEQNAEKYFRKAIEIDPDYLEARASFGGMLLDVGNTDEAIRQFENVLARQPGNVLALTNLAQAYRMKNIYPDSIEAARKAAKLAPQYAEPHLWMAESLRLSGQYEPSKAEYDTYLRLSNFQSKLAGQVNYYVIGFLFGMGKKHRAAEQDIWKDLRSLAYFGMCDCERKLKHYDVAIQDCQKALTYDHGDPYTYYALGLAYAYQGQRTGSYEMLAAAMQNFHSMLEINPDLEEAAKARENVAAIEAALKAR
jgi:tetratricopeptide (TPR) repeat protein